mgnify:CR=1 FL=1
MTKEAKKEESSINLDNAFVKEDDRVLDPTLIDKSILERMPQPSLGVMKNSGFLLAGMQELGLN